MFGFTLYFMAFSANEEAEEKVESICHWGELPSTAAVPPNITYISHSAAYHLCVLRINLWHQSTTFIYINNNFHDEIAMERVIAVHCECAAIAKTTHILIRCHVGIFNVTSRFSSPFGYFENTCLFIGALRAHYSSFTVATIPSLICIHFIRNKNEVWNTWSYCLSSFAASRGLGVPNAWDKSMVAKIV